MLISKTKLNILTKIIFFIAFIFLLLPAFKAAAYKIVPVSGPNGPADGAIRDNRFNFDFSFKVTKDAGEDETTPITLVFAIAKDGTPSSFYVNGSAAAVQNYYIFNEQLGNAIKMSQPILKKWDIAVNNTGTTKKIGWSVANYYDNLKIYANKSFTLGDSNSSGYYHIDKYKRANSSDLYFSVSAKKATMEECEKDKEATKIKTPEVVLGECIFYNKLPETPEDIKAVNTNTNYTLLAPLPDGSGDEFKTFESDPVKNPCPLGDYLNIIIKLFFGICGVLAVIMIVMGGIQYMTSDLISSKEEGKKSITQAIFGLLLALSSWLILNTINPDLLNVCLNSVKSVSITIEEDQGSPMITQDTKCAETSSPVGVCKEGIEKITAGGGSFLVCKKYSQQFKQLVEKAAAANFKLSGGVCRSSEAQIELRKKYCNGDVSNKNAPCSPKVALPGTSRHESAMAVDFVCNGKLINWQSDKNAKDYQPKYAISPETKSCYDWLKLNAPNYEFKKNYDNENWHWSFDGR